MTGVPDLTRLEDLAEKATEAPWEFWPGAHGDPLVAQVGRGPFGAVAMCSTSALDYGRANANFIAEFRNAAPSLLAAARAVQRVREIHEPIMWGSVYVCQECSKLAPCPTVAALPEADR